jgi:hypothetical protein
VSRRALVVVALGVVALGGAPRRAAAYPQLQLRDGQTCTSCHLSPAGGGLLNAMGLLEVDQLAQWEGDAAPLHGKVDLPGWLTLGGDVRMAAGLKKARDVGAAAFPMQAEVAAAATAGAWSATGTLGFGTPNEDDLTTLVVLREHYLMWRPPTGGAAGLSLRAGRFLPAFGLRLAEHSYYVRQYVTPLYSEAYGVAAEYVAGAWEAHLTGFVHDPLRYSAEQGDGGAVYAERRLGAVASVGAGARYAASDAERRTTGALTAKLALPADLLVMAEVDLQKQRVDAGGARTSVTGELLGSWQPRPPWMIDLGIGHHDEAIAVRDLDRDAIDLNVHWFVHPHVELVWMNRVQALAFGDGGPTTGFSLVQAHYRL